MLGKALILQTLLGGGAGGGAKVIIPEVVATYDAEYDGIVAFVEPLHKPVTDKVYTVTYNGVNYDCAAYVVDNTVDSSLADGMWMAVLGVSDLPQANPDAPFMIQVMRASPDNKDDMSVIVVFDLNREKTVTLSIKEKGANVGGGIPQEDIDAAFAALAEKGVTIPEGATSADLDDLIASIVTGGGKYTTGSYTLASDMSDYQFASYNADDYATGHPNFVCVCKTDGLNDGDYTCIIAASRFLSGVVTSVGVRNSTSLSAHKNKENSTNGRAAGNSGAFKIMDGKLIASTFGYKNIAGTYYYIFGDI